MFLLQTKKQPYHNPQQQPPRFYKEPFLSQGVVFLFSFPANQTPTRSQFHCHYIKKEGERGRLRIIVLFCDENLLLPIPPAIIKFLVCTRKGRPAFFQHKCLFPYFYPYVFVVLLSFIYYFRNMKIFPNDRTNLLMG
jgi:hypothetical protein